MTLIIQQEVDENLALLNLWKEAAPGCVYGSSKYFDIGLSCTFRQWLAKGYSHCGEIHGYDIRIRVMVETAQLDQRNWVVDFGALKSFKAWLEDMFDHKTLVAADDPCLDWYLEGQRLGTMNLRIVPATGMEFTSRMIYEYFEQWLKDNGFNHVKLVKVEVSERDANSASYGASTDNNYPLDKAA